MLLGWASNILKVTVTPFFQLLDGIAPGVGGSIANGIVMVIQAAMIAFALLPFYGLIFAALGKYAEIPFISNVVRQQMR